jgi:hypothetical protein
MPVLAINLALGMDESADPRVLPPEKGLLTLRNASQDNGGAQTKRTGFVAVSGSKLDGSLLTIYNGHRIFAHDGDPCMVTTLSVATYAEGVNRWATQDIGLYNCEVSELPLPGPMSTVAGHGTKDATYVDAAVCNGILVHVYSVVNDAGNTDIYATALDATSGAVLSTFHVVSNLSLTVLAVPTRLIALGSATFVLIYRTAANTLSARTMTATAAGVAAGWSGATALVTDHGTTGNYSFHFDAAAASASEFMLAYQNNAGGTNRLTLRTFDASLSNLQTATVNTNSEDPDVSIAHDGTNYHVAWTEPTGNLVRLNRFTNGIAAGTAATLMSGASFSAGCPVVVAPSTDAGILFYCSSGLGTTLSNTYSRGYTTTAGTVTASYATQTWHRVKLSARPVFVAGTGRIVGPVTPIYYTGYSSVGGNLHTTHVLCDFTEPWRSLRPIASMRHKLSRPRNVDNFAVHVATMPQIATNKFACPNQIVAQTSVYWPTTELRSSYAFAILDFSSSRLNLPAQAGPVVALSGGQLRQWDGVEAIETAFVVRPGVVTFTTNAGTGVVVATGIKLVATYEWVDAKGQLHRSEPSDPSITRGAGTFASLTVTVDTLHITHRDIAGKIVLWSTADNGGTGTYYRVMQQDNDPTASTATFTLTAIPPGGSEETLYTTPGQIGTALVRQSPPAMRHVCAHGDRLAGIGDDGRSVFFSGPLVIGEGAWFNAAQQFAMPDSPLTTIWSQDGRLVVATERSLFAVDGDGPPENGGNGTEFSPPRRVSSDVGCIEPRSVVATTIGTFFRSRRGIELLDRSFVPKWIGARAQRTLVTYPVITSAVFDAEHGHVIFSCVEAELSGLPDGDGVLLVYDVTTDAWHVEWLLESEGAPSGAPVSACMAIYQDEPAYHWLHQNGTLYRRRAASDASAYLEGSSWRPMRIETAWFRLAGPSGKAHVRKVQLLCKKHTDHNLVVSVGFNDRDAYEQTRTYTHTEISAQTVDGELLEVDIGNERSARTIRFRIEDATPTSGTVGTGQGCTVYGILVHYDAEPDGTFRRPAGLR